MWGTGSASREFLYVDDAAEGIVLAAERYDGAEPVNLGANQEVPIKELVELIVEAVGFDGEIRWDTSKPDGQPRRRVDASRAAELFGFKARTPFEDGLRAHRRLVPRPPRRSRAPRHLASPPNRRFVDESIADA